MTNAALQMLRYIVVEISVEAGALSAGIRDLKGVVPTASKESGTANHAEDANGFRRVRRYLHLSLLLYFGKSLKV